MTTQKTLHPIVDENDQIIGAKPIEEILSADIYRVASLWVVVPDNDSYKVLINQRKITEHNDPGKWSPSVNGTVEMGETYEENIKKEAAEEISLNGTKFVPMTEKPQFRDGEHKFFGQYFVALGDWKLSNFTPQPEEVEKLDLVRIDDLLRDCAENPDKYTTNFCGGVLALQEYLEGVRE